MFQNGNGIKNRYVSPILWDKVKRGLSAGRVQSVATRLICDREEEIEKFINEYNSKKILLENLYFKQNSFIVERDKKISSSDVLYKK